MEKIGWMLASRDPEANDEDILDVLRQYSAVLHVDEDYPPTCLLHGTDDTVVPYSESEDLAAILDENDIDFELITIDGAEHGFNGDLSGEEFEEYIRPAFDFVERYITTLENGEVCPEE
eukprot:CAMPEP_0114599480 /NCGR_PEP_ID=MMETSP0125-20121206/22016_1 /TAXON_ID=485358 ORGANISM="Aristerostoma sp., Strain ATCC 50986" /NCGR_SAMPLE_ID=MMETSP0125 /ASSEMBLY_ACC=CAM_ASM_000245 /LENGTH=118 /DNA_ID=CAMNT_0001806585 /DNA_START=511 /DNA_END=867 /DNA_ORIENTATION=+